MQTELTIEDFRDLTFQNYMLQKENANLRAANTELKRLLDQSNTKPEPETNHEP